MSWSLEDPPETPPPPGGDTVARTILVAALSALATGLVAWGLEELKEWVSGKASEQKKQTCVECEKKLEKEGWKKA